MKTPKHVCANCIYRHTTHKTLGYDHIEKDICLIHDTETGDTWNTTCDNFTPGNQTDCKEIVKNETAKQHVYNKKCRTCEHRLTCPNL